MIDKSNTAEKLASSINISLTLIQSSVSELGTRVEQITRKLDTIVIPAVYKLESIIGEKIRMHEDQCPIRAGAMGRIEKETRDLKIPRSYHPRQSNWGHVKKIGMVIGVAIGSALLTWFGKPLF